MANYATGNIRTVALVGQGGSGKTTLAEALLLASGAIKEAGTVERGTTVSDFDPLEKTWQHSLRASVLHLDTRDTRIHLVDTPGFPDFIGQAIGALDAVETAAVVVSAQSGIEMIASRMMDWAAKRRLCRLVIVNKIDAENVDLPGAARVDPVAVRQGMPADQPARRRRQARRRLLLQSRRRVRLLVGEPRARRARRPGRRGRRGADGEATSSRARSRRRSCTRRSRRRCATAISSRCASSRRGPAPASPSCSTSSSSWRRIPPKAIRRSSTRAKAMRPRSSARSPIRRSTCSRTCSRS